MMKEREKDKGARGIKDSALNARIADEPRFLVVGEIAKKILVRNHYLFASLPLNLIAQEYHINLNTKRGNHERQTTTRAL